MEDSWNLDGLGRTEAIALWQGERALWLQHAQALLSALHHTEAAAFYKTLLLTSSSGSCVLPPPLVSVHSEATEVASGTDSCPVKDSIAGTDQLRQGTFGISRTGDQADQRGDAPGPSIEAVLSLPT